MLRIDVRVSLLRRSILPLLCAPIQAVFAQQVTLAPGAHVRIERSTCCLGAERGTLVSVSADSLVMRDSRSGALVALPWAELSSVAVGRRVGSHALAGAGLGLLGGAALGAVIGYNSNGSSCVGECYEDANAILGGVGGAALGLVTGIVIGKLIPRERWEPVALASGIGFRPGSVGRHTMRLGVALSL